MAQIYAFREDRLGFHYTLSRKAVLGRAPECDLLIFDRSASRQHAEIFIMDDSYYLADLGSTNGTLLNEQPVTLQTRLQPFDCIKIGQELFIFEPGLEVVLGPAPSALIIESLSEDVVNLVTELAETAAGTVAPEDVPGLMALAHRLGRTENVEALETVVLDYLRERFKITFMSVLWPARPPAQRLISLLTSHEDKRLLLSHSPYIRALRNREVLLWPKSVTELSFSDGRRHVTQVDSPSLVGPLAAENGQAGLMYLENQERPFTEKDMRSFAAMLGIIGPSVARLADTLSRPFEPPKSPSAAAEFFLGSSDNKIKIVFATAAQAAAGSGAILISGESGSGKSTLAEYIHNVSDHKKGQLVTVNLATLPPADIEGVLFGQTDATGGPGHAGLVERADGGTLFLRHVEYLPPAVQKRLLMAIEEGLFFTLGSNRPKALDLRVISSTSIDLWARVQAGYFREDLYIRLNRLNISMPPLREIKQGLDSFLNNFMNKSAQKMGLVFTGLDPAVMECLRAYSWPGNFAELRLEAGRMVLFSRNGRVALGDLPAHLRLAADTFMGDEGEMPPPLVREAERHQLVEAMARCGGDLENVAALLDQRPENVILKMRALGLDPIDYQPPVKLSLPKDRPGGTSMADD
ncbi:MAG: sigma 54-interacting transcriptional regulator [Candidatus Adiutrix sp.]|jgi:DNA-binding NtrC family response regulator|nr:sigma 54-interacting transcriptional regulator [Candidatus Adiutrix sp.]